MRPQPELRLDLLAILRAVERAWEEATRDRPALARTLDEVRDLAMGRLDMDTAIARACATGTEDRRVVRDRLYKRHLRARHALLGALDAMTEAGRLAPEVAVSATAWIEAWLRRRQA